jgi:tetratricopeptide (TPR) repeat protein
MISTAEQQDAIQHNNTAVSLVAAGEYNTAIQELSFALKAYKQVLSGTKGIPHPVKTSLDQCMAHSFAGAADCPKEACLVNDQHYMYGHAIRIPLDIESTMHHQASVMVSSMVIFNLALAHHLSALASNIQHQSKKLHKAATLYELAYNSQCDAQLENNVLFTMAAANNLGLIYHQLEDEAAATKCFQHLLSTVMFMVHYGAAEVCCGGEELDGYLRNVTKHLVSESCAAPAA